MSKLDDNVDAEEVAKFDALAARWWDTAGDFEPLHRINPLRVDFIRQRATLANRRVLDIGCGGGILTESLAKLGANVTGIDAAEGPLAVARLHQAESGTDVTYINSTAEAMAAAEPESFDVVTCLEMLEHVPSPADIVAACARLVKPGGDAFFSTINRNAKAFLFAIVGAEYVLKMLPAGTHEYSKFIRPSELAAWGRDADLSHQSSIGLHYNPLTSEYSLGDNVDVNYLMHFRRVADG